MKTKMLFFVVVAFAVGGLLGDEYRLKSTATNLALESSYTVGSAAGGADSKVVPGPDDIVYIGTQTIELTSGTESFNTFARIGEFRTWSDNHPHFKVTVPDGAPKIATKFNMNDGSRNRNTSRWFTLEKLGKGELVLSGLNNYPAGHATGSHWNYEAKLKVVEGALSFDTADFSGTAINVGIIDVAEGAVFKFPYHTAKDLTLECCGFSGAGLVTNECTTAGRRCYLTMNIPAYSQPFRFSGAIGGPIQPTFCSENDLRGSRSTFSYNGCVSANDCAWTDAPGMMKPNGVDLRRITVVDLIGMRGEASPLGAGNIGYTSRFGGEIYYDGEGEETDKIVQIASAGENNKMPASFNAGTIGGLVWQLNGTATYWEQSNGDRDSRFILRGENAKPCVINCPIKSNSTGYTPNFMKRGTGKWVFANAANNFAGAVTVEEGTLGFNTLAESGTASSLGTSWRLHEWHDGGVPLTTLNALDGKFAFTLGCPTNDGMVAALEYLGANRTRCMTRPFGLNGTGGVLNNGSGELILANATVKTADKETALYLGGTNEIVSTFYDVTNGIGRITVVKDGSGTWRVVNNIDIDAVEVKGGRLVLEKTTGLPYTWFKFIQKSALNIDDVEKGTVENPAAVGPFFPTQQEFCLYDEQGVRQLINPIHDETIGGGGHNMIYNPRDYHLIDPNSIAYDATAAVGWSSETQDRSATNLFDNAALGAGMWLSRWNDKTTPPTVGSPSSWNAIVMRLPENAPKITSCDIVIDIAGSFGAELGAWALEGSRDGYVWEPITNICWNASLGNYTKHRRSYSSKVGAKGCYCAAIDRGLGVSDYGWVPGDATPRPGMGYPFAGVVTNSYVFPTSLDSVKVSGGGTLEIKADTPLSIDGLVVDATTGGSIVNGTYASTGTLAFENVGNDAKIEVPGTFAGLDISNWTVSLPQGAKNREVTVREDGTIVINKRGLMLILK